MATREDTINIALGEVLADLRKGWTVRAEETGGVLREGGRPDVLVLESAGWPVVVEAERENHASAEQDAVARLRKHPADSDFPIETAIALVYPPELHDVNGAKLRAAIRSTDRFEYALYTASESGIPDRLPESGWLTGGVRDLAMLIHRAAAPAPRVDRLVTTLEHGVGSAAGAFERKHGERSGAGIGPQIAEILGQSDDQGGQTRLMAMTVLINALIFHESLAQAAFLIGERRPVAPVRQFNSKSSGFDEHALINEWEDILEVNYWPIFATAGKILDKLPTATADAVLQPLWTAAQRLIRGGVTKSHDLTGVIFQRLIADRKFLATYYTRPAAAALLAALALPADRPPRGSDWSDADAIGALQIGDFACGTGTLLSAAYQRVSLLHELHGGDPKALHPKMMKSGLHGLDVLNIAVHLTAAMLASAHPDTPFEGEALLTMPYGAQDDGSVAIGSLDLLASEVQANLISQAAATTAGGRAPEEVEDLVSRVGHDQFDLVIMNPPFTRPTNHEADHADVPIPAYAAFEATPVDQAAMAEEVKRLSKDGPSHGNAGLASNFVDLAMRKIRSNGVIALVLPMSAVAGSSWQGVRDELVERFRDVIVVTIAGAGSFGRSFSADTGIAECLIVGRGTVQLAEPSRAEPSRAEPSRAEPSRAEPSPVCRPQGATHFCNRGRSAWSQRFALGKQRDAAIAGRRAHWRNTSGDRSRSGCRGDIGPDRVRKALGGRGYRGPGAGPSCARTWPRRDQAAELHETTPRAHHANQGTGPARAGASRHRRDNSQWADTWPIRQGLSASE